MNFLLLFLTSTLSLSCATSRHKGKTYPNFQFAGFNEQQLLILETDLLSLKHGPAASLFDDFVSEKRLTIDYDRYNCRLDQVSCYFSSNAATIYLGEKFWQLSQLERLGSLIHELHHQRFDVPHVTCLKENQITDCDKDMNSAYGHEAKFYSFYEGAEAQRLWAKSLDRILSK